ncbi:nuclear transport factor 2 family protein [Natronomonas sp.]|uniref:nuclear transport factor 2 family protein n=1 Tax=Natronomonas sp. TaxID=2184060 RepID=UPI003975C768
MPTDTRNELIDAYFAALDETDPELARPALSDDFVYESLAGPLEGFDGLAAYITDHRSVTDSTHDVQRRIHDDDVSVTAGVVTGTGPDGDPAEAAFCDVFEFDDADEAIERITVYINDS